MSDKSLIVGSLAVVAVMVAASLAASAALPADARLAVHWNLAGEADGFAPTAVALSLLPLTAALIAGLFAWLPRLEPLREGLARSVPLYRATSIGTLGVLALAHFVLVANALGWALPVDRLVPGAVGVLFVVVGNYLPKSRRMAMVGIRTPWTLADEDVWIATHRVAGRLMLCCGVVLVVLAVIGAAPWTTGVALVGAMLLIAVVPTIYSWREWRRRRPV